MTSSCPAFADGCPFKSADGLSTSLASIPTSHTDPEGSISTAFKGALHELHSRDPLLLASGAGGRCPAKDFERPATGRSFAEDMDLKAFDLTLLMPSSLSSDLKTGTQKSHKEAENVSFVRSFLKGKVTKPQYVTLVGNLYHVYVALEAGQDANPELLGGMVRDGNEGAMAARAYYILPTICFARPIILTTSLRSSGSTTPPSSTGATPSSMITAP